MRINKFISKFGSISRRQADRLISDGRVTVNNQIIELGYIVEDNDNVKLDGEKIKSDSKKYVYLAFNKPRGIVCTTDAEKEKDNIIDFINFNKRIYPIGRLDKLSEGLILLTNDGEIVNKVLRSRYRHEKEYLVTLNKKIESNLLKNLSNGVPILKTVTRKCETTYVNDFQFKIVLTQGLNRQIRRMCEYFDYRVKKLERIRIININLDIPTGKWRHLTSEEISTIKNL
tara:strand:+ start:681 stop:1367 length:687 start_codon:yes stop_codon:yes gene_type:complete